MSKKKSEFTLKEKKKMAVIVPLEVMNEVLGLLRSVPIFYEVLAPVLKSLGTCQVVDLTSQPETTDE